MTSGKHPRLDRPPINEVVCGFIFNPISEFTPAQHGAYWVSRRADFPSHEMQPPLVDQFSEGLTEPLVRTWLVTADETRLVQLQQDRLFTNWRKRRTSDEYPRFSTRDGRPGLLAFAMAEFERLSGFLTSLGRSPTLHHVELTKIDVLVRGLHWKDDDELRQVLPWAAASLSLGSSSSFLLRLEDRIERGVLRVTAANGFEKETRAPVIRLETTARLECGPDAVEAAFTTMNEAVNRVFFNLIPEDQLGRFMENS